MYIHGRHLDIMLGVIRQNVLLINKIHPLLELLNKIVFLQRENK